jgi:hypothetical protein
MIFIVVASEKKVMWRKGGWGVVSRGKIGRLDLKTRT